MRQLLLLVPLIAVLTVNALYFPDDLQGRDSADEGLQRNKPNLLKKAPLMIMKRDIQELNLKDEAEGQSKRVLQKRSSTECLGEFQCHNGGCINPSWLCDGWTNCGDNSDESSCVVLDVPIAKIIDSSEPYHAGGEPDKAIDGDSSTHWNPNIPNGQHFNNWYITFELTQSYSVTGFKMLVYGDDVHDITSFKLEASDDQVTWQTESDSDVPTGSRDWLISTGPPVAGKYLKFTVTGTYSGWQPWLREIIFTGIPVVHDVPIAKIIDSSEPYQEGREPDKAIDGDPSTIWNTDIPNGQHFNNWYITFELTQSYSVSGVNLFFYGDDVHDITSFKLEASDDQVTWENPSVDYLSHDTTRGRAWWSFIGPPVAGKYLKFTVTGTYSGWQPWLPEIIFTGIPVSCSSTQFQCKRDSKCISGSWKCDNENDCADGSDEEGCGDDSCYYTHFPCKSDGKCVSYLHQCDNKNDCADGTDEEGCVPASCSSTQFQCKSDGRCISGSWKCDNENDCDDGSDEEGCGPAPGPGSGSSECDYSSFGSSHTMNLAPNTQCGARIHRRGVSDSEIQTILQKHNELRAKVANGDESQGHPGPQPGATNMLEMIWNPQLAEVAQAWTEQCPNGHDSNRKICGEDYVGQNIYYKWSFDPASIWEDGIQVLYDEVEDMPNYFVDSFSSSPPSGKVIGHYTQVVWADSYEVGCGAIYFEDTRNNVKFPESKTYVCNYGPGGNWLNEEVYEKGNIAASNCPNGKSSNYNGLCAPPA